MALTLAEAHVILKADLSQLALGLAQARSLVGETVESLSRAATIRPRVEAAAPDQPIRRSPGELPPRAAPSPAASSRSLAALVEERAAGAPDLATRPAASSAERSAERPTGQEPRAGALDLARFRDDALRGLLAGLRQSVQDFPPARVEPPLGDELPARDSFDQPGQRELERLVGEGNRIAERVRDNTGRTVELLQQWRHEGAVFQ